jgi:hypothetical protein
MQLEMSKEDNERDSEQLLQSKKLLELNIDQMRESNSKALELKDQEINELHESYQA